MTYAEEAGPHFDPLAQEFSDDFYPSLQVLRERCPLLRSDTHGGFAALTRYDDVAAAAKNWRGLCSGRGIDVVPSEGERFILLESDPPYHRALRKLLAPLFSRDTAAAMEPALRAHAKELFDAAGDRVEFVAEFALPFPSRVAYETVIGAPLDGLERTLGWLVTIVTDPEHSGSARAELTAWAQELLDERSRGGVRRQDLIQTLVDGSLDDRPLRLEEKANLLGLMLLAAIDNTTNHLAAMAFHLAADPDLLAGVRSGAVDVEAAVEEFLRYDPSVPALGRTAVEDVAFSGGTVAAGERVLLYYAAANRDPGHFPAPETFDPAREPNHHLTFGIGVHQCIGRHVARLELRIALQEIAARWGSIALDPAAPPRFRHGSSRGFASLPLHVTTA